MDPEIHRLVQKEVEKGPAVCWIANGLHIDGWLWEGIQACTAPKGI